MIASAVFTNSGFVCAGPTGIAALRRNFFLAIVMSLPYWVSYARWAINLLIAVSFSVGMNSSPVNEMVLMAAIDVI